MRINRASCIGLLWLSIAAIWFAPAGTLSAQASPAPKPNVDGVSFWPTLLGQPEPELARDLYFVRREGGNAYGGKTIEAFRRGDWKLLQDSPFAPLELYDLKSDPQETTDLARKQRQVFNQLSAGLRKQIQRGGQTPWQPPSTVP
jgi:arylsulfatase A-like enzyme